MLTMGDTMRRWSFIVWIRSLVILVGALFIAAALAYFGIVPGSQNSGIASMGYLVVGGLIAAGFLVAHEWIKSPIRAADLSVVLHAEISDRAARCCFDCETWAGYVQRQPMKKRNSFDIKKFTPLAPVIYPATASQLAILNAATTRSIIEFYFRLGACQRNFPNIADKIGTGTASDTELKLLYSRFERTLQPALDALISLGAMVSDAEKIENNALDSYDHGRNPRSTEKSLRRSTRSRMTRSGRCARRVINQRPDTNAIHPARP